LAALPFLWDQIAIVSQTGACASGVIEEFTNRAVSYSVTFLNTATFLLNLAHRVARLLGTDQVSSQENQTKVVLGSFWAEPLTMRLLEYGDDNDKVEIFTKHSRGIIGLAPQGVQPGPIAGWKHG